MQKTIFINSKGNDVQAAITGMLEQLDKMSADVEYKNFEVLSSSITVTFEAPPKKSNLVPMNGGMVQPVMVINHTVCLVEKNNQLPGEQEIKDLKKAYQMRCAHQNLSTGGSWTVINGADVFQVICKDCGAWVTVPGAKKPGSLEPAAVERILADELADDKADMQIPIDPIGDQLDEQDGRRPGLQ